MADFITVGSSGAFQLESPANQSLRVTHEGGQTVFYSTSPRVSTVSYDGSLTTGGQFTFTGKRFFITQAGTGTQGSSASLRLDAIPLYGETTTSRPLTLNALDYGVNGDGTDETAAIQSAFTAAIASGRNLVFPDPPITYLVTSTITLQPASGDYFVLDLEAAGPANTFTWGGGNNTSMFRSLGWKNSRVRGMDISLATGTGVVAWDIDGSATYPSCSFLDFENCTTSLYGNNQVAWRIGHSAGCADHSYINWDTCLVAEGSGTGQTGWVWEHANCLVFHWDTCAVLHCAKGWTGVPTAGTGSTGQGGGGHTWTNCGATGNTTTDFELATSGNYTINGGRYEDGEQFVLAVLGDTPNATIAVSGSEVANYTPATGRVFELKGDIALNIRGLTVPATLQHDANFIYVYGAGSHGDIIVDGSRIASSVDPFWTVAQGTWRVHSRGNTLLAAGGGYDFSAAATES